jgi:FtsZ-binding cell division protein ZapB
MLSAESNTEDIEATRMALEKWVDIQQIISREKRDFAFSREILNERIELVQHEIETLHEKILEAETSIAEADIKRGDMLDENENLKNASSSLGTTLGTIEKRTIALLNRLPDPIRDRVKPLSQRVLINENAEYLSISERFQNVIGILNEIDKFNRDVSVTSEVRALPDGTSAEVTVLYLGIGQAYYSGSNGVIAGRGFPTDSEWIWESANEAGAQIARAIAILKNEEMASFIQLPIEIQ